MKATDHGHTGFPDGYGKVVRPQDNLAGALRGAEEAKERLLQKLEIADRPYPLRCASYCHPSSQGRGACCTAYFNSRNRDCHGLLGYAEFYPEFSGYILDKTGQLFMAVHTDAPSPSPRATNASHRKAFSAGSPPGPRRRSEAPGILCL